MSNNNSFGGKLRRILASMCSLFVGASGVSQAGKPGTKMPDELKLGKDANVFGFGDIGWKLESPMGDAKWVNSWLVRGGNNWQRLGKVHGVNVDVGFFCSDFSCDFTIWVEDIDVVFRLTIPSGILFDVMRYFECNYFSNNAELRNNGTRLSCAEGRWDNDTEDEVFLCFILWAFCGADNAIKQDDTGVDELKAAIFEFAVKKDDFDNTKDEFIEKNVEVEEKEGEMESKKYGVLKPGYFLENFSTRVCDVYKKAFGCNLADMDDVVNFIAQLNGKITQLDNEKKDLKNQKHTSKYLLSILGAFVGGGALVEGAHRFLGAKRSRSSEVNKGKTSSNKKGEQKAKKELKKRRG